jgi:beta-lactamase superfamily II metal-dependent hydrolase
MKLTILPSEKGDCLLLESADGKNVLVDGGMYDSYKTYVRPLLGKMKKAGKQLDLVYVSHTDQDQIAGVLQLMNDLVDWRVYKHKLETNGKAKKPGFDEPPEVKALWHNAFHDMIQENAGEIESMLAASAVMLANSGNMALRDLAVEYREIATSIPEAIKLSRRASAEQLKIPLNKNFGGKLAMVREKEKEKKTISIGTLRIRVIGPFEENLDKYRKEWNLWLKENKKRVADMRRQAEDDADLLKSARLVTEAAELALKRGKIGDRKKVTAPNLASLMLFVEEKGKRLILTGDGHPDEIIKGLEHHGILKKDRPLHVDVLKVPHHGAEYNTTPEFAKRITADHYVFCGNGGHHNPDLEVVTIYADARLGKPDQNSTTPQVDDKFTFWFSSNSAFPGADAAHMRKIETLVADIQAKHPKRLVCKFLEKDRLPVTF